MGEYPGPMTPDRPHWYDRMIERGFAEKAESYVNVYYGDNHTEVFNDELSLAGNDTARLLDVGCGPGKYTAMVSPSFEQVIGLDLSAKSIDLGNKIRHVPNLAFVLGDSSNLPFSAESFDAVSSRLSPHDLSEFMRVLKPGGFAIAMRVGSTDALELRRLFGQKDLVDKMDRLIAKGEPHGQHIEEEWREKGFVNVKRTEHEYDMHFASVDDLAKYLSRIPIVPNFDINNVENMEMLQRYASLSRDLEFGTIVLHRHRYIIRGNKPKADEN